MTFFDTNAKKQMRKALRKLGRRKEDSDAVLVGSTYVDGIFSNNYVPVEMGNRIFEANRIEFECLTADLPTVVHGTTVTVDSVAYSVAEIRPEENFITVLLLTEPT